MGCELASGCTSDPGYSLLDSGKIEGFSKNARALESGVYTSLGTARRENERDIAFSETVRDGVAALRAKQNVDNRSIGGTGLDQGQGGFNIARWTEDLITKFFKPIGQQQRDHWLIVYDKDARHRSYRYAC